MFKVLLDGVELQVNTNGVKPGQLTVIDDSKPWLARDQIASSRYGDDAQSFEVVSLSGKRHRIAYAFGAPATPTNNDTSLSQIYAKYMQTAYDISGEGLAKAQAQYFFTKYAATQLVWAKRAQYLAQINDPDITASKRSDLTGLIGAIPALLQANVMTLSLYGTTVQVFFGEGQSCQFTDWVISDHTDFQFSLISRTLI